MIKNKKGAEHVDWAISIGIFLLFLLTILVYIKPVYKPTYEAETLGEMIKDSFLAENNRTIYRTLVIVKYKETPGCDSIKVAFNNLGNIYVTKEDLVTSAEKYKKGSNYILFPNLNSKYWVYYNLKDNEGSNTGTNTGWNPSTNCLSSEIKETTEYIGLKSSSSDTYFDLKNKIKGFPESKEFRITARKSNGETIPAYTPNGSPTPPEDVSIYVYEFIYPLLEWKNNQPEKINYIVSIQIW